MVSGDRSRRRLSSELPCALPLLVAGDMAGDATRRGVRGGIIRRGEEKTSMAMFAVGMKERLVTVTTRYKGEATSLRHSKSRVAVRLGLRWS